MKFLSVLVIISMSLTSITTSFATTAEDNVVAIFDSDGKRTLECEVQQAHMVTSNVVELEEEEKAGTKVDDYFRCSLEGGQIFDLPDDIVLKHWNALTENPGTKKRMLIEGGRIPSLNGVGRSGSTSSSQSSSSSSYEIMIPPNATISILPSKNQGRRNRRRGLSGRGTQRYQGTSEVLIIRAHSWDSTLTHNRDELYEHILGDGDGVDNADGRTNSPSTLAKTYRDCSFGKMNFVPATGNDIRKGVGRVEIQANTQGMDFREVENLVTRAINAKYGSVEDYDHVIYCLPKGTSEGWLAYGYMDWYRSVYNDDFCAQHSALVHEVGHNIGLHHSNEEGLYKDQTCMLGFSYRWTGGPRMCFNAHKNYFMGWYSDRTKRIGRQDGWTGMLVAFVDYDKTSSREVVLLAYNDIYMQYNLAKGINREVNEKENQLVIVEERSDYSENLAGLREGDRFEYDGMFIEFCTTFSDSGKDMIEVSIYPVYEESGCYGNSKNTAIVEYTISACFSGTNTVITKDRGLISMKELQIGDQVMTTSTSADATPRFETVYSFGHRSEDDKVTYLQILPSMLEITHDHMIFIKQGNNNNNNTQGNTAVPASSLQVGDILSDGEVITSIKKITRKGVYAPFTASGDLNVNGIHVSSYLELFHDNNNNNRFGKQQRQHLITHYFTSQWLSHTFTFPRRFWCTTINNCKTETYTENGVSTWWNHPKVLMQWWLSINNNNDRHHHYLKVCIVILDYIISFFMILLVLTFACFEFIINNNNVLLLLGGTLLFIKLNQQRIKNE
mmetsp:Transcript_12112/g.13891  ORF Transcript_12112/g.13891 Transcript_12112/m.13891 type:complete len:785 (-) Transcript_12112:149-2503(-)